MQYTHRKLHRSVTEMRKSRSGRSSVSTGVPERCGRGAARGLLSRVGIAVPTDARPASPLGTVPRPGPIALVAITGSGRMAGMVRGDRVRVRGDWERSPQGRARTRCGPDAGGAVLSSPDRPGRGTRERERKTLKSHP